MFAVLVVSRRRDRRRRASPTRPRDCAQGARPAARVPVREPAPVDQGQTPIFAVQPGSARKNDDVGMYRRLCYHAVRPAQRSGRKAMKSFAVSVAAFALLAACPALAQPAPNNLEKL